MSSRASLVVILALHSSLVFAQGQSQSQSSPQSQASPQSLSAQVAALAAQVNAVDGRVAKLEGYVTAADFVGTYAVISIQLQMGDVKAMQFIMQKGTVTLDQNGSANFAFTYDGWGRSDSPDSIPVRNGPYHSSYSLSPWTYDSGAGILTINSVPYTVALGGRLLTTEAVFNTGFGTLVIGDTDLQILTRLH